APKSSPAPAPRPARLSAPAASACATSPACEWYWAWSWLVSIEGEAGAERQRIDIAPIEGLGIGGDGVVIGGLGLFHITQHQIGAQQLRPFFDTAAFTGQAGGQTRDHLADHFGFLRSGGGHAVILGHGQTLLRR